MFGLGKSKTLVGLDIGSSAIKAVELRRAGKEMEVVRIGMDALPADIIVDGAIVDQGHVSESIVKIFTDAKITNKQVATSVSGHAVIVKKLSLQTMTDEELEGAIQAEASQNIPFDLADVNLDYQVLEPSPESVTMDVLLVAVKKDKIAQYKSAVDQAGRSQAIVDIDVFALQNAYEFNYDPADDTTVALLNLGASVMNINIVRGRNPLFTRDVSIGGNQYTDSLQKELDLRFEEAERVKMGIPVPGINEDARVPIMKSVSEIIVLEIQKTFDFFRATAGGEQIQKLYLAGGSARVFGLADLLKQELGIPVEELNPFRKIKFERSGESSDLVTSQGPRMAVAVGLALRSFEDL